MRNAPYVIVLAAFCVVMLACHRSYVETHGTLPGVVETFKPTGPQGPYRPHGDEEWHFERVGDRDLYRYGPLGPDGTIIPRYYCNYRGNVWGLVDEQGSVRWQSQTPGEFRGPWRVAEPIDSKTLTDSLNELNLRLRKGNPDTR